MGKTTGRVVRIAAPMNTKHISRVVTKKTIGWQVRLMRERKQHSKFFSDGRHGGTDPALEAALQYRDTLLKLAPKCLQNEPLKGIDDGIHLESAGTYKAWVARWVNEDGERKTRKFAVSRFGNLRAKQMARQARMLGVARLDKVDEPKVPTLDELVNRKR